MVDTTPYHIHMNPIQRLISPIYPKISAHLYLKSINLELIRIPKVSVDGETLIQFEKMFSNTRERWTHVLGDSPRLQPVKEALKKLVQSDMEFVNKFNFCNLQSFSASKSFSMEESDQSKWWIASKHHDALSWGLNMREDQNLKFTSDKDFSDNIRHLKFEGIGAAGKIRVFVYGWHDNRVYWANTGGSHHAAALIRQCHLQNREFHCNAEVTKYQMNVKPLNDLSQDFYILLMKENCNNNYPTMLALHKSGILFSTHHIKIPLNDDCKIVAIPKSQNHISSKKMREWLENEITKGTIIDFISWVNIMNHKKAP